MPPLNCNSNNGINKHLEKHSDVIHISVWDKATILDYARNHYARKMKESININLFAKTGVMNFEDGMKKKLPREILTNGNFVAHLHLHLQLLLLGGKLRKKIHYFRNSFVFLLDNLKSKTILLFFCQKTRSIIFVWWLGYCERPISLHFILWIVHGSSLVKKLCYAPEGCIAYFAPIVATFDAFFKNI